MKRNETQKFAITILNQTPLVNFHPNRTKYKHPPCNQRVNIPTIKPIICLLIERYKMAAFCSSCLRNRHYNLPQNAKCLKLFVSCSVSGVPKFKTSWKAIAWLGFCFEYLFEFNSFKWRRRRVSSKTEVIQKGNDMKYTYVPTYLEIWIFWPCFVNLLCLKINDQHRIT